MNGPADPGAEGNADIEADVDTDVVVIGAGVSGLIAARECARKGLRVTVFEARESAGGFVATHELAGLRLDSGAESFATRGGAKGQPGPVATLIADLGLADEIVAPNVRGAWVQLPEAAAPLPKLSLLGIPGAPLAEDVRRILGWRGALRAQLDRYIPLLRVRTETDLGGIVRRRMGRLVLDRLVTPIVAGVHSASPTVVDVHTVAPGLTKAMTNQGSLSGAVLALLEERESKTKAGSAVGGLRGGMFRLIEALREDCEKFGVEFRFGCPVDAIAHVDRDSGVWRTEFRSETEGDGASDDDASSAVSDSLVSHAVIVASSFRSGLALLGGLGVDTGQPDSWPAPASVELATLVIDDARLDAAPRGTGVLVAADVPAVRAKALTHATIKWDWLAASAGPGRHVVRLSYDRPQQSSSPTLAEALADASVLLGLQLDPARVAAFDLTRWNDSLAFATVGHRARVSAVLADAQTHDGLRVVGAWVAGTGLAATVPQARDVASNLALALALELRSRKSRESRSS